MASGPDDATTKTARADLQSVWCAADSLCFSLEEENSIRSPLSELTNSASGPKGKSERRLSAAVLLTGERIVHLAGESAVARFPKRVRGLCHVGIRDPSTLVLRSLP